MCIRDRYLSGPDEQRPFDVVRFVRLQRGPDMTEQHDKPGSIGAQPGDASAAHDAQAVQTQAEFRPVSQQARKTARKRKLLAAGGLAVIGLAGLLVFGIPWIGEML